VRIGYQPADIRWLVAGFLLVVAILFGGGGSPAPAAELVVQLGALAALIAWFWLPRRDRTRPRLGIDWPLFVLAGLFVLIPVIQLVPLPPAIWHALPGRDVEQQALALVGAENGWMPLSVSPGRTLASLLSLIAPMAMLFFVARLTVRDRSKLLGLLAALALLSVVVGAVQLASGHSNWLRFYGRTHYGYATGFQASRNAEADLLIISSMALAAWAVSSRRVMQSSQARLVVVTLIIVMWLSVIVTGSRSGVAMILIALATNLLIAIRRRSLPSRRVAILSVIAVLVVGSAAAIVLHNNVRVERTLARFDDLQDVRPHIWADTLYAIGEHWPAGTGIGTFQPVFDAAERLEFVRDTYANRAHNDYLEYLLEAGIAGALLIAAIVVFAIYRIAGMLRRNVERRERAQALWILGSLLGLGLHSLVDYPLRSMSLGVLAGLMGGLLWRSGRAGAVGGRFIEKEL
jgi:O-antigen ligase